MANPTYDDDDEPPLDPVAERVQARLRRLILISGLTLGVGIFAVFGAILYRIVADDTSAGGLGVFTPGSTVPTLTHEQMGLPTDARLVSTAVDGNRLLLTYETGEGTRLVLIDAAESAVVGTLAIEPE